MFGSRAKKRLLVLQGNDDGMPQAIELYKKIPNTNNPSEMKFAELDLMKQIAIDDIENLEFNADQREGTYFEIIVKPSSKPKKPFRLEVTTASRMHSLTWIQSISQKLPLGSTMSISKTPSTGTQSDGKAPSPSHTRSQSSQIGHEKPSSPKARLAHHISDVADLVVANSSQNASSTHSTDNSADDIR